MKTYIKIIILIFSILLFSSSKKWECKAIPVRQKVAGGYKFSNEEICKIDKNTFVSKSCFKKNCQALKEELLAVKRKEIYSQRGTPGFKICYKLKAMPYLIDYMWETKWIPASRCMFKDKSFISTEYLTKKHKPHLI